MKPFLPNLSHSASTRSLQILSTALALSLGASAGYAQGQTAQAAAQAQAAATPAQATAPVQATTAPAPATQPQQAKLRTVAVAPVDVPASLASALRTPAEREALSLFADLLQKEVISRLNKSGTFQVVQRQDLSRIIAEQDLGQSGNVDPQTAARIGELTGAQVLATIDLLQFDYMLRQTHAAAINRDIVTVSLDAGAILNLIDTSTGALIASNSATGNAVDTKQYFAGDSKQQGSMNRAPVTDAAMVTADKLVNAVATELFPTRVIAVTGKQATLNRGSGHFKNGDLVDIIQYGTELRDPDTGRSLGREEVLIGHGKVARVTTQTTTITITEDNGVQPGQVVVKQEQ